MQPCRVFPFRSDCKDLFVFIFVPTANKNTLRELCTHLSKLLPRRLAYTLKRLIRQSRLFAQKHMDYNPTLWRSCSGWILPGGELKWRLSSLSTWQQSFCGTPRSVGAKYTRIFLTTSLDGKSFSRRPVTLTASPEKHQPHHRTSSHTVIAIFCCFSSNTLQDWLWCHINQTNLFVDRASRVVHTFLKWRNAGTRNTCDIRMLEIHRITQRE